mgnify:CR=1 FL=1
MTTEYVEARCPHCGQQGTWQLNWQPESRILAAFGLRWRGDTARGTANCPHCGVAHNWRERRERREPDLQPRLSNPSCIEGSRYNSPEVIARPPIREEAP